MPWLAGAVVGSSVIGAGGSLLAANAQSSAAKSAANIQKQGYMQTREDLNHYNDRGNSANSLLANALWGGDSSVPNLLTANGFKANATGGGQLTFQPTQAELEATPGYQFTLAQGLKSVQNSAAARGLGTSGAALKGAAQYATGLADNTLKTQQGIFQQNLSNVLNPLQSMAQLGENAAAQTGQQATTSAANIGSSLIGAGNATAGGIAGAANALGSAGQNYLLYNRLLKGGGLGGGGGDSGGAGPGGSLGSSY